MLSAEPIRMATTNQAPPPLPPGPGHVLTGSTAAAAATAGYSLSNLSESFMHQQLLQSVRQPQTALASSLCANLTKWAIEHECGTNIFYENINSSSSNLHAAHNHLHLHQTATATTTTTPFDSSYSNYLGSHNNMNHYHCLNQNLVNASAASALSSLSSSSSPLTKLVTNHLLEPTQFIESKLNYYFSDIWLISGDERTNKLPFIGAGPWKLIYATLVYLYLIKWLLPRLMRPFKPLELNWPIRLYNLSMVMSNMWAFYQGARILNFGTKCFGCETINHQDYSVQAMELLHYGWLFFLSRLVEWLDTIFFVLRKKERQVTKLHVFHHSFVPLISWTYLKYHPGYTVAFFPFINSFVHSIMYIYYLLATFGPKVQPYLWWKRYLTSLQIAQFVLIIIQLASIPLTGDETCQYPRGFLYVAFAGAILFLWLFFTYYIDTYSKRQSAAAAAAVAMGKAKNGTDALAATSGQSAKSGQQQRRVSKLAAMNIFATHHREGSSRSLSDLIDNSIGCEESATQSSAVRANKKSN